MPIDYVEPKKWKREKNYNQTGMDKTGYGKKISTAYKVFVDGKWYRVYATCYSNAASYWIVRGKTKFHLMSLDPTKEEVK